MKKKWLIWSALALFVAIAIPAATSVWYNANTTGKIKIFKGVITNYKDQSNENACSYYVINNDNYVNVMCHGEQQRAFKGQYDKNLRVGENVEVRATYRQNAANSNLKFYDIEDTGTYIRITE